MSCSLSEGMEVSEAPRACGRLLIFSVVKVKKKGSCDNNGYLLLLGLKEKITGTIFFSPFFGTIYRTYFPNDLNLRLSF